MTPVFSAMQKIIALRNAPDILLSLNNEVVDLRVVVEDVNDVLLRSSEITQEGQPQSICRALEKSKETLLKLESLISYELTSVKGNQLKLDRSAWLRTEPKVQRLRDDIHADRVCLSSALSLLASSTSISLNRQLHLRLDTIEAQIAQTSGTVVARLETMTGPLSDAQEFPRMITDINPASDGFVSAEKSTSSGHYRSQKSQSGTSILCSCDRRTRLLDGAPEASLNLGPGTHNTGMRLTLSTGIPYCTCACHKRIRLRSPKFMSTIIGSLFVGYSATPWLPPTSNKTCCRLHSIYATYTYAFPRWFVDCLITFRMTYYWARGPELCLRLVRLRPDVADIFLAAGGSSTVHHIKRLLLDGKASVLDVNCNGQTPLHVMIPQPFLRSCQSDVITSTLSALIILMPLNF